MKYAKSFFYFGITGLILFEIANVYFIMPMPGSQDMNSIDLAYFLYRWRWVFQYIFSLTIDFWLSEIFLEKKVDTLHSPFNCRVDYLHVQF